MFTQASILKRIYRKEIKGKKKRMQKYMIAIKDINQIRKNGTNARVNQPLQNLRMCSYSRKFTANVQIDNKLQ